MCVGRKTTPDELRGLLRLAAKLRAAATESKDQIYVDLFLRAAMALEERALLLSTTKAEETHQTTSDIVLRGRVDIRC